MKVYDITEIKVSLDLNVVDIKDMVDALKLTQNGMKKRFPENLEALIKELEAIIKKHEIFLNEEAI